MALTIAEILNLGKGRAEYAFHPAGITWVVHTGGLDWSSVTTPQKKIMFGTHLYGANPYAALVDPYPYLDRPGTCTVSLREGQGLLSGGDWSAVINPKTAKVTNNVLNSRSGIQGLEALQAVANTRNDSNIAWGRISDDFGKADTTLDVADDLGGNLSARITAADGAGVPYLLWAGAECIAASAVAPDGDEIDITVPAGYRGLFLSKKQSHYLDNIGTPLYVADAPLNGLVGRPGDLWMFVVDSAGAQIADPVLIRTGKIEKLPQLSGGVWQVPVLPWWSWLDYEMDLTDKAGQLDRYQFSRSDATTQHPPHMQISESVDSGVNWGAWADVWLCGAGATVRYDDFNAFKEGVRVACTAASGALNAWTYHIGNKGPYVSGAANRTRFRGPLPAICRWGSSAWNASDNFTACQDAVLNLSFPGDPWDHDWWSYYAWGINNQDGWGETPVPYIYQMHRNADTDYDEENTSGFMPTWPPTAVGGTPSLWVKDSGDIAGLGAGDIIEVGTAEFIMTGDFEARSTLAKTVVNTVVGNEIRIDVAAGDEYMGLETLIGVASDSDPSSSKHREGMYLYYRPTSMITDPWPVRFSNNYDAPSLSSLFKTALGDTTDFTLSERIVADHVPRGYATGNWTSFVDWDTLDQLASTTPIDNMIYQFRFAGKLNLWTEFQNCLRFLGLTPTFEWSATDSHYIVRFRLVGHVDATMAQISGRVLDEDYIDPKTKPSINNSTDPLFNQVNLAMNYNPVDQSWGREEPVKGNASYITGGKTVSVDTKPRFIRISDVENETIWTDVTDHVQSIINRTMTPTPSQTITATIKDKFAHGVGVESLVTVDDVFNPYLGTKGLENYPALITTMAIDLDKCAIRYTYRVAPGIDVGWGPACIIPAAGSTVIDGDTIEVDDISDDMTGRNFTDEYPTFGWYDHWPLGNIKFNETMSAAQQIGGLSDKQIILVERGTATPTVITGLTAVDVDERDYATIAGAGDPFFDIEGAHVGFNAALSWVVFFAPRDTAGLTAAQYYWVYIADTVLQLQDSGAVEYTGNFWL